MASLLFRVLAGIFGKARGPAAPVDGRWAKRFRDQGQLDAIRLNRCELGKGCTAACCAKGASMPAREAERIAKFVKAHPGHFRHAMRVDRPIVPLDTLGKPGLWQTEVVTPAGVGKRGLYRAVFEGRSITTKDNAGSACVFLLPDCRCSLQVAAEKLGLHKWEYKPIVCWLFPLKSIIVEEKNGCRYYGLVHAGSVESQHAGYPCSRVDPAGRPARELLKEEIDYYRKEFIGEREGGSAPGPGAGKYDDIY